MPPNFFTSMIPPGAPIPDPPEFGWIKQIVVAAGLIALFALIGFIFVEYMMDSMGTPLDFSEKPDIPPEPSAPRQRPVPGGGIDNIMVQALLLSPANRVRIPGKTVTYLSTWSSHRGAQIAEPPFPLRLQVDGFFTPWTMRFGNNTWFLNINLQPGLHRFRTSFHEIEVFVEGDDPVEAYRQLDNRTLRQVHEWKQFRFHEGVDSAEQCGDCHLWSEQADDFVRKGHEKTIGSWKGGKSCLDCHSVEKFETAHAHPVETFENCARCHAVHGTASEEKSLLRAATKSLCIQCHEKRP